ncbi:MAG: hypothetical protein LQ343_005352 [Gyalolechia ehrenbergii]|nr:MAG: hypothetical protein LQ343_005352 [Gyalolechia ehrenbergii]
MEGSMQRQKKHTEKLQVEEGNQLGVERQGQFKEGQFKEGQFKEEQFKEKQKGFQKLYRGPIETSVRHYYDALQELERTFKMLGKNLVFTELIETNFLETVIKQEAFEELIETCEAILGDCESGFPDNLVTQELLDLNSFSHKAVLLCLINHSLSGSNEFSVVGQGPSFEDKHRDEEAATAKSHQSSLFSFRAHRQGSSTVQDSEEEAFTDEERPITRKPTAITNNPSSSSSSSARGGTGSRKLERVHSERVSNPEVPDSAGSRNSEEYGASSEGPTEGDSE